MPKNYGAGLDPVPSRSRRLHDLVQLVRQDLWLRMDRNMVAGPPDAAVTKSVAVANVGAVPSSLGGGSPAGVPATGNPADLRRKPGASAAARVRGGRPDVARRD